MPYNKIYATCDCRVIHDDVVQRVRGALPADAYLRKFAAFFKVFGDETRVRVLWALHEHELCVCDLGVLLGLTKSVVSHQLRILREYDLVRYRRVGKVVYYAMADEHIAAIFEAGVEHLAEREEGESI
jgi:ArsR family transcriptional regulator